MEAHLVEVMKPGHGNAECVGCPQPRLPAAHFESGLTSALTEFPLGLIPANIKGKPVSMPKASVAVSILRRGPVALDSSEMPHHWHKAPSGKLAGSPHSSQTPSIS